MSPRLLQTMLSIVFLLGTIPGPGARAATISFSPSVSSVSPGGSFTVDIYGTSVNSIGGFSLYLNSSSAGGQFQITAYALNTSLFNYGSAPPAFPSPISSTGISQDLGAFSNSSLAANTQYLLGTATITAAPGTVPANYSFGNSAQTVFADPGFAVSDFAPATSFNVAVVPEPSIVGLLAMGLPLLALISPRLRGWARAMRLART